MKIAVFVLGLAAFAAAPLAAQAGCSGGGGDRPLPTQGS